MQQMQTKQSLEDAMAHIKNREDNKIKNRMNEEDIKSALQDIRKMKGAYLKEDKKKELKDLEQQQKEMDSKRIKVSKELIDLDDDVMHTAHRENMRKDRKVENSRYFNNQNRGKNELVRNAVEEQTRLKFKNEILNNQKSQLDKGINISDLVSQRGRSIEPKSNSLLRVGNDISSTNNNFDYQTSKNQFK
jgi:hypothetical protein